MEQIRIKIDEFLERAKSGGKLIPSNSQTNEEMYMNLSTFNSCARAFAHGADPIELIRDLCVLMDERDRDIQNKFLSGEWTINTKQLLKKHEYGKE